MQGTHDALQMYLVLRKGQWRIFESNGKTPNDTVNFDIRPQHKLSNQAKLISCNASCSENIINKGKKQTAN
jgi:hypothetical protein